MKQLNIFLDLDINKCGYAIFLDSEYKQSGILKSNSYQRLMEKPTQQTKSTEPKIKTKLNKDKIRIGEWRKDPPTGKWKYWMVKFVSFKFNNDIDRAEHMTSRLIDTVAMLEYGEVNKINLYIEDSNSNHRKLEYIGMVKTYLWEALEYRFKDNDKSEIARITLDDIFNVNVNAIKNKLKNAYLTLLRKTTFSVFVEDIIMGNTKFLSKQVVEMTLNKKVEDDEADAINMIFYIDKVWYLKNLKNYENN